MKATASAKVMVEVHDLGAWGNDCTVGQIKKQAEDAVKSRLARALAGTGIEVVSSVDVEITLRD